MVAELEPEAKKTKRVYTIQQKRRIVAYAKEHSTTEAHEYFSVPRTTITAPCESHPLYLVESKPDTK